MILPHLNDHRMTSIILNPETFDITFYIIFCLYIIVIESFRYSYETLKMSALFQSFIYVTITPLLTHL